MDLQPVMSLAHLMCNTIKINRKLVQDYFSFNNTWNFIAFPNSQSLFSLKSHSKIMALFWVNQCGLIL